MKSKFTYESLFRKLVKLGFVQRKTIIHDNPQWIFTHKDQIRAVLLFPIMPPDAVVEPHHRAATYLVLVSHGIEGVNGKFEQELLAGVKR